ncbi:MAG TPA: RNA polymerase sigma factor [Polyangiaceae bacterium]|jgi:RNA polymerase sigma-70 factor (ECF subfamily)|nr:RNA polymerase sigma factor [Polyangiaceae bacterium]
MAIDWALSPERQLELDRRGQCLDAFRSEFDYLWRTLRRLGISDGDVEDVLHEVFLVLHRRWADYRPAFPLRPWLFGIAFRVASAHRRRLRREVPHAWIELEDLGPHPDEQAILGQRRQLVLAALEHVPLGRRAVLVMHDLDGAHMREIAATLSIPLFTAYSRLRKARQEFELAARRLERTGAPR